MYFTAQLLNFSFWLSVTEQLRENIVFYPPGARDLDLMLQTVEFSFIGYFGWRQVAKVSRS